MKYIEGLTIFNSLAILVIVILMIMYKVDNVKETFSDGTNLIVAEDDAGNLVTVSKTELEKLIDDRAQAKIDKIPPAGLDTAGVNAAIDARVTAAYINGKLPGDIIRTMDPIRILTSDVNGGSNAAIPNILNDNFARVLSVDAMNNDEARSAYFQSIRQIRDEINGGGDKVNQAVQERIMRSQLFISKVCFEGDVSNNSGTANATNTIANNNIVVQLNQNGNLSANQRREAAIRAFGKDLKPLLQKNPQRINVARSTCPPRS